MDRADEVRNLLNPVQERILQFIRSADRGSNETAQENGSHERDPFFSGLIELRKPHELQEELQLEFPARGQGRDGLLQVLEKIFRYSVNIWHQGFLDKLYASTNAPGLAAELIIAALNTNVHVYQVAPALTVIEKNTAARLASLFGLTGECAGGISVQGGSASNATAIVVARNTLFPHTKAAGIGGDQYVLFTSAHGHYSVEKAAQMLGFGSKAVWTVSVDEQGRMIPEALEELVTTAKSEGKKPFFVNATAGTTVYGAFDPLPEIAEISRKHNLWFHVDASWGGSFIFSSRQKGKLTGSHLADSIAFNPHKMLNVPLTCSFLLGADLRKFHRANTLPAGYLFHNDYTSEGSSEVWDLGDLTLQCGRRGDSLKFFLSWLYYGSEGYEQQVDSACSVAEHLSTVIGNSPHLILITENPPPCLQVCFYYAPLGRMAYPPEREINGKRLSEEERGKLNSKITEEVVRELVHQGFMVDYAPPSDGDKLAGDGKFFRCVVNVLTKKETVDGLVETIVKLGSAAVRRQLGPLLNVPPPGELPDMPHGLRPKNPAERGHGPVVHS
ncbi:Glutamate decarboxylase 2 [Emydomyces testavorans]|uniref:Glutamate decarboxylase 2 n=1 Tax=Emydomyces testavorans TaxID=2070801 RepID=A0AAF0DB16_9EURO|nr:Glutamate decarboxylase 2 [Emydomyces testavorans]